MDQPPSLTLSHVKTNNYYEDSVLFHRYWFEWADRKDLLTIVLRIELLNSEGDVLFETGIKLPKVTILGFSGSERGRKPIYSSSVQFSLNITADQQPSSFRYYTMGGMDKKSAAGTGFIDSKSYNLSLKPFISVRLAKQLQL